MWSDNDIDNAFQRLNPPEPEPTSFPLDAWLRLENQLDKAVIERAVRQKLWRFFAAEVAVVALVALGWLLWPVPSTAPAGPVAATAPAGAALVPAGGRRAGLVPTRSTGATATVAASTQAAQAAAAAVPSTAMPGSTATVQASLDSKPALTAQPASVAILAAGATHSVPVRLVATPDAPHQLARKNRKSAESLIARGGWAAGLTTAAPTRAIQRPLWLGSESSTYIHQNTALSSSRSVVDAGAATKSMTPATAEHDLMNTTPATSAAGADQTAGTENSQPQDPAPSATAAVEATVAAGNARATNSPGENAETAATAISPSGFATLAVRSVALDAPARTAVPAPLATTALPETVLPAPVRQPRFYIGLVGAPDVSTVKFTSVDKPLPNVGITLEYRLTNRLRVSTGLLRSTKKYTARREDYDFGAFTSRVYQRDFADVEGACTVLDVPLNLRYALLARPQYQVFGSVGLSSYFMQREDYSYEYQENNMPKYWEGYAVNQNRHLLSILNLSVGYERSLGSHWSVQAEPYLKMPLAGVGLGKVRLTSGGIFFGVKYGF